MSESALLSLVLRYPDAVAVARRVSAVTLHEGIRRLEGAGLVVRRRNSYRVTARGRSALEFHHALGLIVRRAFIEA